MLSNDSLLEVDQIKQFITELDDLKKVIRSENCVSFYDSTNLSNFLIDIQVMESIDENYPRPISNMLRTRMKGWKDWRNDPFQTEENTYSHFSQSITDHTFCEIAEHKHQHEEHNFIQINHQAHTCPSPVTVSVNDHTSIEFDCVSNQNGLFNWFSENRLPRRAFQAIDKHGENRAEGRNWRGDWASPLMCSAAKALELLKTAIGNPDHELYNYDPTQDHYIIFKFEGGNPQNMYHGYHVVLDSDEVPKDIKSRLPQP